MTTPFAPALVDVARRFHTALPGRIRAYLNGRGIPDLLIDSHLLGWDDRRITIPIYNRAGELTFFKLARDPEDAMPGPKMLATRGARAEFYGWESLLSRPRAIVICEGEFDRLVLEAHGFAAVTSTGGAGVFRPEWAPEFADIANVYVCFDNDAAGQRGAERVAMLVPHARIVELPSEVGPGGDVTDYFVRLERTREQFEELLGDAMPLPPVPAERRVPMAGRSALREHVDRVKEEHPIAEVLGRYVRLRVQGRALIGKCPFHPDHEPSLAVFPERNNFHCFGCGKHGDAITFVRGMEGLGFREAIDRIKKTSHDLEPAEQ